MRRLIATVALVLLPRLVFALDISTCGQTVPEGESAVLLNDLDCPVGVGVCAVDAGKLCPNAAGCPSGRCLGNAGVVLENRARLDLNGHTIRGGDVAVECVGRSCEIGGGTVESAGALCSGSIWGRVVDQFATQSMQLTDLTVSGGGCITVYNTFGRIKATNVTVTNGTWGLIAGSLDGASITVSGNAGHGLYVSGRAKVAGLTANENLLEGIVGGRLIGSNIVANGNGGHGISAGTVRGTNVTTSNNGSGGTITQLSSRLENLTAVGNGGPGYESIAGTVRISGGTITGNTGADLLTKRRPRLRNGATCGVSRRQGTFDNWDVCTLD